MKVAEDHFLQDLYREASRFLLDSWSVWEQSELSILSSNTLLKLEKRRTWFLERLLKLGLINTQRDYVCCQSCPDPQGCGRMVRCVLSAKAGEMGTDNLCTAGREMEKRVELGIPFWFANAFKHLAKPTHARTELIIAGAAFAAHILSESRQSVSPASP